MALSSDVTSIESKETGGKRRRSPCRRVSRTSGRSEMSTFLATIISSSVKKSHIWTSDTSSRVSILLRMNARTSLITTLQAQIVAISVERWEFFGGRTVNHVPYDTLGSMGSGSPSL
ncbi:uncharacterized protein LOC143912424 [Arctopsyche grandis]|uniref:uncharacterized protein LOC143912424 n=1 Tax=Arctopsyche grandis TaxID=121162 RepID=UPI00406D9795